MQNDVALLGNQIEVFYSQHGSLPILDVEYAINIPEEQKNPNDGEKYYVINLDALEDMRLHYGKEFEKLKNDKENITKYTDLYVVNEQSHTVYYVQGINVDGTSYYRDNETYSKVDWTGPIEEKVLIGDYVDYTPESVPEGYTTLANEKYSGSTTGTIIKQETMKWRVLSINQKEGTIELIGEKSKQGFPLKGAIGYNNGVYLLNDCCKTLYSNSSIGATARSVNVEDVKKVLNEKGLYTYENFYNPEVNPVGYGETYTFTDNRYYPLQWKKDDASKIETESESRSLTAYTSQAAARGQEANALTVTSTHGSIAGTEMKQAFQKVKTREQEKDDTMYWELFCNTEEAYWLASRYAATWWDSIAGSSYWTYVRYGLRIIAFDNALNISSLTYSPSNFGEDEYAHKYKPIVTLPIDRIDLEKDYEENGNKWSIK